MSDLLESHGGHALAAGLSVRRERLPELRRRFEALVREQAGPEDFVKRLTLDGDLALRDCDLDLIMWLDRLSPHGLGNPEPLFRARDVEVESCSAVRNGHLKLKLRDGTGTADAIGFGMGGMAPELPRGRRCEVAFVPSANDWMGETRVQLKLKGVRPS
jgi:single-stranded-DNA-specific exonuclease